MADVIKIGAILDGLKTYADGTLKVSFALNEIPLECAASLVKLHRKFGWLVFDESGQIEVPDEPPREFRNDKSPSQRLRAVLYILFQQTNAEGDFDTFYRQKMETMIGWVKERLNAKEGA